MGLFNLFQKQGPSEYPEGSCACWKDDKGTLHESPASRDKANRGFARARAESMVRDLLLAPAGEVDFLDVRVPVYDHPFVGPGVRVDLPRRTVLMKNSMDAGQVAKMLIENWRYIKDQMEIIHADSNGE